ncbi:MAG: helicase HerA domain-containing protein, partial [Nitrososphaerales archaeon]
MPAVNLIQIVRSAVERNIGIPAMLDAYSQFVDSPMGDLELSDLDAVFSAILENLSSRYPQIASQRAANTARNDISDFLSVASSNPQRVKDALKSELRIASPTMCASIWERFSRANAEEKRAIDATLRLLRSSSFEILFRAEPGKLISTSGSEFEGFFTAVRSESPGIRDLRYQNLIVEKGIFNKLILKSKNQDYVIWVPSFFAKENINVLIDKTGLVPEHILYSRLKELGEQSQLDSLRPFLATLIGSSGVIRKDEAIPQELRDFMRPIGEKFVAMSPIELDDVFLFLNEENTIREKQRLVEETRRLDEASKSEARKKDEDLRHKRRISVQAPSSDLGQTEQKAKSAEGIYIGKQVDLDHLASAIARRSPDSEINSDLKIVGDYYSNLSTIRSKGVSIVGSSGSGKSMSLNRLLEGIGSVIDGQGSQVILIDPKGEHRGIAWKYKWQVFGLMADHQAQQFRVPFLSKGSNREEEPELFANMLQEWCLHAGLGCSNQQRLRMASIIRSLDNLSVESLAAALLKEQELEQIAKKLSKNLLAFDVSSRMFSEELDFNFEGNVLFDISGRGLRDPTTKEERLLLSVLVLKALETKKVKGAIIV